MVKTSIALGNTGRVTELYSYPNQPGSRETLAATVAHWFGQTLDRDGFKAEGATATVRVDGDNYFLDIVGPDETAQYGKRLPQFLDHGWDALGVIEELKTMKKDPPWPDGICTANGTCDVNAIWDPQGTGDWRFFLPHGLPMIRQQSLQFFHYPPMRLLDAMRDYLDDPVPVRLTELLVANGVASDQEAYLYETVMDGAPIAAPDDQGTIYLDGETIHLIPIEHFREYQRAQVSLLLNTSSVSPDHTIPIIVYGGPARSVFSKLYGVYLKPNQAATVEIIRGKQTPVIGSNHPYMFYAQGQSEVGSGSIEPDKCAGVVGTMKSDCAVARWQKLMAADPTQDPEQISKQCSEYWDHEDRAHELCTLVQHQGSLRYPDPKALEYGFDVSMKQAEAFCTGHGDDPCATA